MEWSADLFIYVTHFLPNSVKIDFVATIIILLI